MEYALVIYNDPRVDERPEEERCRITAEILDVLERPNITAWLRLQDPDSATTVRFDGDRSLLTDGPFLDSKEYLGGFIVVEAADLDGALALAHELQELRAAGSIEVRPVRDGPRLGA